MSAKIPDSQLLTMTELLSHLYLGLTRYLDSIHENSEKSKKTREDIQSLIQTSREGLAQYLSMNPVVQRSVEEEQALVSKIVEEAMNNGLTPKVMEKMTTERAKFQTKIVALTDLIALYKSL